MENKGYYLFKNGELFEFWELKLKKIKFGRETGALRVRTTLNEVNVDFIVEKKPTEQQLNAIKQLKEFSNRKLVFEITDKDNRPIKRYSGFDKTISEMRQQLIIFYNQDEKTTSDRISD